MNRRLVIAVAVLVLACAVGWLAGVRLLLAAWLAAWWFVTGALMGGLANVWLHDLTGGAWGEAIRGPLLRAARWLPLACLLFVPVLAGVHILYPWAVPGGVRWHEAFSAPDFKRWWLSPGFFALRSIFYLLVWSALAWLSTRRTARHTRGAAAASLLVYALTSWFAALDWIMSLQPQWYSSVFGWLAATGQMLAGLALAVLLVDRHAARKVLPDLCNLLLMYVMTWGYLAYVQFLIIWAEDLPHEIAWYVQRSTPGWKVVAWVLVAFHLAVPFVILLSRHAKRSPEMAAAIAGGLLAAHLLDCWWLVLPPVAGNSPHLLWLAPLVAAPFCAAAWLLARSHRKMEVAHA